MTVGREMELKSIRIGPLNRLGSSKTETNDAQVSSAAPGHTVVRLCFHLLLGNPLASRSSIVLRQ